MTGAGDKAALRKAAAAARAAAHGRVDPRPATERLDDELKPWEGRTISFYMPFRTEIDPRPAMVRAVMRGPVCLPVSRKGQPLEFRIWEPGIEMERDAFGIETPPPGPEARPDVLVVPLLAFDRRGHRLGYGAGHYDRTLAALRTAGPALAIGFAYAAQEVGRVPDEPTDVALDMIVTEAGVVRP